MATTAGLPLAIHQDESILLLSDSDDDEAPTTPKEPTRSTGPFGGGLTEIPEEEEPVKKTKEVAGNVPLHPIPAMQSAFAESLVEATADPEMEKPKLRFADAKERRARLIDAEKDSKTVAELWRQRPGQSHHELWKLMAQISFGVYLLLNGIANSNIQVVNILQGHINEVDEFLEVTMEDIKVATEDIQERIDFLKLPMQNMATFEKMLEDRNFRIQIVTGNEKIEHIVSRTATALEGTLTDVREGLKTTKEFAVYLGSQQNQTWRTVRPDVIDIFNAMKGNAEGWYKAFVDLQENASALDNLLVKLGQMVAEMDRRAGEVSRRTKASPVTKAYELQLRASALMPLQFSVPPDSGIVEDAHTSKLSLGSSRKSSQRSSTSRAQSGSTTSSSDFRPTAARSPSQKSPPSSPTLKDTLSDAEYRPQPLRVRSSGSRKVPVLEVVTSAPEVVEGPTKVLNQSPVKEEGLYILQPRTYTPQPPEPEPEPEPTSTPASDVVIAQDEPPRKSSLRQRLSQRGSHPPESIQVPPRSANRPKYHSPRVQIAQEVQVPDSAYGSDPERRPHHQSIADNLPELSPPVLPNTIPSPRSDQQYFRPVQASPHSPLQRPWTSGNSTMRRPHTSATQYQTNHQRNIPSAMGMSMLSNVTTINQDGKTLKKKRSAFGWLKKAFSLDEEERAAFEARKQQQLPNRYYDARSPKYLDGKRREEYRRYA